MLLFVSLNTCRGFFIISSQYWIPSYCFPSVVKLCNFTWPWRGKLNKVIQGKNKSSLFTQMGEIFGEIDCFRLMWTTWVEQEIFFRQNLQKSTDFKKSRSFPPTTVAFSLLETSLFLKQGSRTSWNVLKKTLNRFPFYKQPLIARSLSLSWRKRFITSVPVT